METVIFRQGWFATAKNLTDSQFREFVCKTAYYGFSECGEDVTSKDETVCAMLEIVKPAIREGVEKYFCAF